MLERMRERFYESKAVISWYESKAVIERDGGGVCAHIALAGVYRAHFSEIDKLAEFPLARDAIETIPTEHHRVQEPDPEHNPDQNNND